jgi:Dolichyl-phosphate-mannose-protein mannosyltransferase
MTRPGESAADAIRGRESVFISSVAVVENGDRARGMLTTSMSPRWCYAILLLILAFSGFVRFRLREFPLERDEGEYAYAGQLILQGIPPYQLAYNMKLPGAYAAYAVVMGVFGQTASGIHTGVLLLNAATIIVIYLLAERLFGRAAALVAAASYSLLSMNQTILGIEGHAEHFVLLPTLAGILLLMKAAEARRTGLLFWSGALLGLSFLMKQPGVVFVFFGGIYLLALERKNAIDGRGLCTRIGSYSAAAALPLVLTWVILLMAGVFQKFWFWTFSYAAQYASNVNFEAALQLFRLGFVRAVGAGLLIWLMAAVGLVLLFVHRAARERATFVGGFLLFSFIAVCPGLHFREHYFILMLPAVSLLAGTAVTSGTQMLTERRTAVPQFIPILCFILACSFLIVRQRDFLFRMDPLTACRSVYGENPFPEAVGIADYIKSHSSPADQVAVLGSEPEIYFYSQRHSATGHIYMYGLMEPQKYALQMQQEMIQEIESAQPKFVVYVDVSSSWLASPDSQRLLLDWAKDYLHEHYEIDGVADIVQHPTYRWGEDAKITKPRSPFGVYVFKRKDL